LKSCLITPPILGYPNFTQPFELHTDASGRGLGAILYQEQEGHKRVIAYASRGLTKCPGNLDNASASALFTPGLYLISKL
jgi:hypothetical protein